MYTVLSSLKLQGREYAISFSECLLCAKTIFHTRKSPQLTIGNIQQLWFCGSEFESWLFHTICLHFYYPKWEPLIYQAPPFGLTKLYPRHEGAPRSYRESLGLWKWGCGETGPSVVGDRDGGLEVRVCEGGMCSVRVWACERWVSCLFASQKFVCYCQVDSECFSFTPVPQTRINIC